MPTLKPRVQVTLEPATHAVIERLAQLQSRTRGAVIADLLDSVAPSLTRTIALLEAAAEAPNDVKRGFRAAVESAHQELVALSGDASRQLDAFLDSLGDEGANPHVVTRGSGMGVKPPHAKPKKPRKRSKPGASANG
jgi:hypothetical protein